MMNCEVSRHCLIELAVFISFSVNFGVCQSIREFRLSSCHSNCSLLFFPHQTLSFLKKRTVSYAMFFLLFSQRQASAFYYTCLYGRGRCFLAITQLLSRVPLSERRLASAPPSLPELPSLSDCASPLPEKKPHTYRALVSAVTHVFLVLAQSQANSRP